MTKNQKLNLVSLISRMSEAGFTFAEVMTLRRCEMTLGRWGERECGDGTDWALERDETTDKPFNVYHGEGKPRRYAIADKEKGALKRASAIAKLHGCEIFHQTDPRGCCLYITRKGDIPDGADVTSCYNNGIAMCI